MMRWDEPYVPPFIAHAFPMWKPDDAWSFTDAKGHVHRWVDGRLPSTRYVVDVPASGDYNEEGHQECRRCGEEIRPRYRQLPDFEFDTPPLDG